MRISDWSSDLCSSDLRRNPGVTYYASLDRQGGLEVSTRAPSHVAQLIDVLHQQVGLPFDHEIAMPIMGGRSEERRVGKACVSTWRSRWSTSPDKKNQS